MKDETLINKMLRLIVHNSFLITVAFMCFVHATLLVVMLCTGVVPLVHFNVLSVVVYMFCIILCTVGYMLPVYVSILLEVSAYVIVSTYCIGWECGSVCFLCSIVPIIIYFGSLIFKGKKRLLIILFLFIIFGIYVVLYLNFETVTPPYELPAPARQFLVIFASFVMIFSMIFYNGIYIFASEYEVFSLEIKNRQLSVDAKEDLLTNLLNRRGFLPVIEEMMNDGKSRFCIAFCDIDNFKRINDSHGHDCGDEVLRHITRVFKREMQGCDICRWGGEEIIILMKDYDFTVAKEKMEYLRKVIESTPTVFFNQRIPATITIGVEEYTDKYQEPEEIIKVADERMYYGKQHGKNIVVSEVE